MPSVSGGHRNRRLTWRLTWRRLAATLLVVGVAALHWGLADRIVMAWSRQGDSRPARLTVAFVRTLQLQPPPPVAPAPTPLRALAALPVVAAAVPASAAAVPVAEPFPEPEPPPPQEAQTPAAEPALAAASAPGDVLADAPASPAAAAPTPAASAPAFEWPPSTRLRYVLTGNYRGPIDGSAQVQWLRQGERYQVHLDVHIGPPFAAIIERQMSSDGLLGVDGLHPRRYDERTQIAFRDPRALTMFFDADAVQLASGQRVPRPPGVQDAVSQFVQMTWRFTLQPALLTEGTVIELPLALPRRVETWVYDVRGSETLWTPAGPVEAVHVQPRREPRPGGDLVAEMWFAPALQYLPVRITIRQDAQTWIDLLVDRLPEQAGPETAGPPPVLPSASPSPEPLRRP